MAAVVLGGCGGAEPDARPVGPRLPHGLGERLAVHAETVADALAAGDCARGSRLARALQAETIAAINRRRVPQALLEDLQVGVNVLVDDVRCPGAGDGGSGGGGRTGAEVPPGGGVRPVPTAADAEGQARNLATWLREYSR